jgi:hypothetical protein
VGIAAGLNKAIGSFCFVAAACKFFAAEAFERF